MVKIYFSDFFNVSPETVEEYGAFNISLINDLPLFIDPFLLFNSKDPVYQRLHEDIIHYLIFLRDRSVGNALSQGLVRNWYVFGEVRQTWLGFSKVGNRGSGLGRDFAYALHKNLKSLFANFGTEKITRSSHLEKLCLIDDGVGRDNISDFTTNLIKGYLADYTQNFARQFVDSTFTRMVRVPRVRFNYYTESWEHDYYQLPYINEDFVLLTPRDLLTKDETWISRQGLRSNFEDIAFSIPDFQLRAEINNYFSNRLKEAKHRDNVTSAERRVVINDTIHQYPQVIEYYIKHQEENGEYAEAVSSENVRLVREQFYEQVVPFVKTLQDGGEFYKQRTNSFDESLKRLHFLKHVIENQDGYKIFYLDGKPIKRELDLQILFRLVWFGSEFDVNREVNNGRGPVDYKVSRGSKDQTLVEFKLASNSKLKQNLEKQVDVYEAANNTKLSLKAVLYFSEVEHAKVQSILNDLGSDKSRNIMLINARADDKPSASMA